MRLIHTKKWTESLAAELGNEISVWPQGADIAVVVFDNKAYFTKTKYQHVATDSSNGPRFRADGEFLHTVNWFHLPIYSSDHVQDSFTGFDALPVLLVTSNIRKENVYECTIVFKLTLLSPR